MSLCQEREREREREREIFIAAGKMYLLMDELDAL